MTTGDPKDEPPYFEALVQSGLNGGSRRRVFLRTYYGQREGLNDGSCNSLSGAYLGMSERTFERVYAGGAGEYEVNFVFDR